MTKNICEMKKVCFSIVVILLLVLMNVTILNSPSILATGVNIDQIEVELGCYDMRDYPEGQVRYDGQDTPVIMAQADRSSYNFFYMNRNLDSGTYKYYFKARSEIGSKISIGINDDNQPRNNIIFSEDFLLTTEYRWYISDDFVVSNSYFNIWAHTTHCIEFIDKIILVRWKDNVGSIQSGTWGQIKDNNPSVTDSDGDGIPDSSTTNYESDEYNDDVWWLEAEHLRLDNNVRVVTQDSASNSKSITIRGDLTSAAGAIPGLGVIPMLRYNTNTLPKFKNGYEFQLFVRAKGPKGSFFYMEAGDSNCYPSTAPYLDIISSKNDQYSFDREYRWFSSPKFLTSGMTGDQLWLQIYSLPPPTVPIGETFFKPGVYVDKLMLIRTKIDINTKTTYQYGQLTDHLDPDTDLDGRSDGFETNYFLDGYRYCHEAENWISHSNQLKFDEQGASNSISIIKPPSNNIILNIKNIFADRGYSDDYYRIYFRARTEDKNNDIIEFKYTDGTMKTTQYFTSTDFRWFFSPKFNYQDLIVPYVGLETSSSNTLLDKIMVDKIIIIRYSVIVEGQVSDPLDSDMDWDKILDGDEVSNDVYWVEGETKISTSFSNSDSEESNSFSGLLEQESSFSLTTGSGIYQLYFKVNPYGPNPISFFVTVVNTAIQHKPYTIESSYEWYSTQEFSFTGSQLVIQYTVEDGKMAKLDKFMVVRRADISSNPTSRPSGIVPTDPLDPDIDKDIRKDGDEYSLDLRWFEVEHHLISGLVEDMELEASNNLCFKKSGIYNDDVFSVDFDIPAGEYHYFVRAKNNNDESLVKLSLNIDCIGCHKTETKYLISDFKWYNFITFNIQSSRTVTLSGSCEIPSGMEIIIDRILLVRTLDENVYPTGLTVSKILEPRDSCIYLAKPGMISDTLAQDSDGDSYFDYLEVKGIPVSGNNYVLDPLNSDTDNDNLLDNIELNIGTNPLKADSDGDLIPDGWIDGWGYNAIQHQFEFGIKDGKKNIEKDEGDSDSFYDDFYSLEFEDKDRDGVIKKVSGYYEETNPDDDDTDGDGINDNFEYLYEIDPLDIDSDDDGRIDNVECSSYGDSLIFYPHLNMANIWDYDNDGLNDGLEIGLYRNPSSITTDPITEDTEAGINFVYGTNPSIFGLGDSHPQSTTLIKDPDSDDDGLLDGEEDSDADGWIDGDTDNDYIIDTGETWFETNPNDEDTDTGGIYDGIEVSMALDPLDDYDDSMLDDSDSDGLSDFYEKYRLQQYSEVSWSGNIWGDWGLDCKPNVAETGAMGTDGRVGIAWVDDNRNGEVGSPTIYDDNSGGRAGAYDFGIDKVPGTTYDVGKFLADGIDNNDNGETNSPTWYKDTNSDSCYQFGEPTSTTQGSGSGWIEEGKALADAIDNDNDGESNSPTWYQDTSSDGYYQFGEPTGTSQGSGSGWVNVGKALADGLDNDGDGGIDENIDEEIDEYIDNDYLEYLWDDDDDGTPDCDDLKDPAHDDYDFDNNHIDGYDNDFDALDWQFDAIDNDGDFTADDGRPAVPAEGTPEATPNLYNGIDDDNDGVIDDGCSAIAAVGDPEGIDDSDPDDDWGTENNGEIDGYEPYEELDLTTNQGNSDTDGDNKYDLEEIVIGCKPLDPDSDGDGIRDDREGNNNDWDGSVSWTEYFDWKDNCDNDGFMNAIDIDSDDDGLDDNEEAHILFRTNVWEDGDGDNFIDYDTDDEGKWIAIDLNNDGEIKRFGRKEYYNGDSGTLLPHVETPEGYEIYITSDNPPNIYIRIVNGLSSPFNNYLYTQDETEASYAVTDLHPSPDYVSHQTWSWFTDPCNPDTDDDGLTDYEEVYNTLGFDTDPLTADSEGLSEGSRGGIRIPSDPNRDTDGDGLTDSFEKTYTYQASNIDWDGDGSLDYKTNWLSPDTDWDGLLDGWEYQYYNENNKEWQYPLKRDSDDDGIMDGDETVDFIQMLSLPSGDTPYYRDDLLSSAIECWIVRIAESIWIDLNGDGTSDLITSPTNDDTDSDTYLDGQELIEIHNNYFWISRLAKLKICSLPNNDESRPYDTDGDANDGIDNDGDWDSQTGTGIDESGRDDMWDYEHGDPNKKITEGINIYDADDDNDGLMDWEECNYDGDPTYNPDSDPSPYKKDTDADGLNDYFEVITGWDVEIDTDGDGITDDSYHVFSSPVSEDIDGDGFWDIQEADMGSDPNNPDTDDDGVIDLYDQVPSIAPKTISYTNFPYETSITTDRLRHDFMIQTVPAFSNCKTEDRIRIEVTIKPTENCYVLIKGPIDNEDWSEYPEHCEKYEKYKDEPLVGSLLAAYYSATHIPHIEFGSLYGWYVNECFTDDGFALLGYAIKYDQSFPEATTSSMRVTIVEGGTYVVSVRRDQEESNQPFQITSITIDNIPQSPNDKPPLYTTLHYGWGVNLNDVNLVNIGITSKDNRGDIEKQMFLTRVLGMEWVRFDIEWKNVQPSQNTYKWEANHWHDFGQFARKYALKLYIDVGTHQRPKEWTDDWGGFLGCEQFVDDEQDCEREFVKGIVERVNSIYSDEVICWQPHNEPGHLSAGPPIHYLGELVGFINGKKEPHQEIALNPNFGHGAFWAVNPIFGYNGITHRLYGWNLRASERDCTKSYRYIGDRNDLTICGVDIYPEYDLIPFPNEHVMEAVVYANMVRNTKSGRETWIVEMPEGFCQENTEKQKSWIETAILFGSTAIGLYQISEKDIYMDTITSIGAYGIMMGDGGIYYNDIDSNSDGLDDHDYYMMVASLCGVKYNILEDNDPGARMLANAFFKVKIIEETWP